MPRPDTIKVYQLVIGRGLGGRMPAQVSKPVPLLQLLAYPICVAERTEFDPVVVDNGLALFASAPWARRAVLAHHDVRTGTKHATAARICHA